MKSRGATSRHCGIPALKPSTTGPVTLLMPHVISCNHRSPCAARRPDMSLKKKEMLSERLTALAALLECVFFSTPFSLPFLHSRSLLDNAPSTPLIPSLTRAVCQVSSLVQDQASTRAERQVVQGFDPGREPLWLPHLWKRRSA